MQSLTICFPEPGIVEIHQEDVRTIEPHEVLLKASRTLISAGTESRTLSANFDANTHWSAWTSYPFVPGYSFVGRVVGIGSAVEHVREGDRVAATVPHQQFAIAPASELFPIPDEVTDEEASWFRLASIVQHGVRRAEHALGEAVCVVGLGPLGQLVVQYLRLLGARQVIATDPIEQRVELARQHGATTGLAMDVSDARETIMTLTEGRGVEAVYDMTGNAIVFSHALGLLRPSGRLILIGDAGSPAQQSLTPDVIVNDLSIIAAHAKNPPPVSTDYAYWSHARMVELFFTYLQRGDMKVADLITHRFSPLDAPEAYELVREKKTFSLGVLFDWMDV